MNIQTNKALTINAPEFFADKKFQAWLSGAAARPTATWHQNDMGYDSRQFIAWVARGERKPSDIWPGLCTEPTDCSDVFVLVDPSLNGEGSDSDMPMHIWSQIIEACKQHFAPARTSEYHIIVRLTNEDE